MKRRSRFGGSLIAPFLIAVAILILAGHICAAPSSAHELFAAPGHAGETSHDTGLHSLSSCEALASVVHTTVTPSATCAVAAPSHLTGFAPDAVIGTAVSPASLSRAERPPLFVLHASLLI